MLREILLTQDEGHNVIRETLWSKTDISWLKNKSNLSLSSRTHMYIHATLETIMRHGHARSHVCEAREASALRRVVRASSVLEMSPKIADRL